MDRPRIALHGKIKSGKTTLARELSKRLGLPVYSFAEPLREAATALGFDVTDPRHKEQARWWMQTSSKQLTDIDDAHFVKLLERRHPSFWEGCLIDDLRRPVEYSWAARCGFLLVKLEVSRETQLTRGAQAGLDHDTETALDFLPDGRAWDLVLPEYLSVADKAAEVETEAYRVWDGWSAVPTAEQRRLGYE